jgi:hypothetical protein
MEEAIAEQQRLIFLPELIGLPQVQPQVHGAAALDAQPDFVATFGFQIERKEQVAVRTGTLDKGVVVAGDEMRQHPAISHQMEVDLVQQRVAHLQQPLSGARPLLDGQAQPDRIAGQAEIGRRRCGELLPLAVCRALQQFIDGESVPGVAQHLQRARDRVVAHFGIQLQEFGLE